MEKKKFNHIMSINLVIETETENRPSNTEVMAAIKKFLKENKEDISESLEWVDTEESS